MGEIYPKEKIEEVKNKFLNDSSVFIKKYIQGSQKVNLT